MPVLRRHLRSLPGALPQLWLYEPSSRHAQAKVWAAPSDGEGAPMLDRLLMKIIDACCLLLARRQGS